MDRHLTWVLAVAALSALVAVASLSSTFAVIAVFLAALATSVIAFGSSRTGAGCMALAYLTAPAYKGLASSPSDRVTPTDVLLTIGVVLLLPVMARHALRLPAPFVIGVGLVALSGAWASLLSADPLASLGALVFWLLAMFAMPLVIAWWAPVPRMVDTLIWAFVLGQVISTVYALIDGPVYFGRYLGLATHPNYFGEAGMLCIALLIHQYHRTPPGHRWIVWGAALICGLSVLMSGSRAATVVVVALMLLVPVLERSAFAGYFVALAGVLLTVSLGTLSSVVGDGSSLGRLGGAGTAAGSDSARALGLEDGWRNFLQHPLQGNGLIDLFDIHNNFLEVAVAVGLVGLVGYLTVLWSLASGLFSDSEFRRLGYVVLAYIGFGATIPSLNDRTIWPVVALAILITQRETKSVTGHDGERSTREHAALTHQRRSLQLRSQESP